jgi:trehalose 6-phosphate phosphatase
VRNALEGEALVTLRRFARRMPLLAFDFDGTLAAITSDRDAAGLRPRTRELLVALSTGRACVVVSGRSRADLARRLGVPRLRTIGNHGAEPFWRRRARPRALDAWKRDLRAAVRGEEGIELEDKGLSLAAHYRRAPNPRRARAALRLALARLEGARVTEGKAVFNVCLRAAPHKGEALQDAMRRLRTPAAIFVGDDVTDEDVFGLSDPRVLTIRVGRSHRSRARYFVVNQRAVNHLLEELLRA